VHYTVPIAVCNTPATSENLEKKDNKPDAGNPHLQFDKRDLETEHEEAIEALTAESSSERSKLPCPEPNTTIPFTLLRAGSILLVFEPGLPASPPVKDETEQAQAPQAIKGPWKVMLLHVNNHQSQISLRTLVDFNADKRLYDFAGEAVYPVEFQPHTGKKFT
jgi:hypothetical protein